MGRALRRTRTRTELVVWSSGLAASDHAAYGESENEQGDKTIDQERLSRVSRPKVRPRERQHQHGGYPVEVVCGTWRSRSGPKHDRSSGDLHQDKRLTNRQCSCVAARNGLPPEIGDDAPCSDDGHK